MIYIKNLFVICCTLLFSCTSTPENVSNSYSNIKQGHAVLIGYKVAKHSHVAFKLIETNTTHDIDGMGGRREPNMKLFDTVIVNYCIKDGYVVILHDGSEFAKEPLNINSRIVGNYNF